MRAPVDLSLSSEGVEDASTTLYAPTNDGWRLAVHYFSPKGRLRRHPLLLVHGLGANRLHFDLDERYSFARAARDRGFAVYVVELRGSGLSRAPGGRNRFLFQWGFEDFAERDMPIVVATVLEHSGKKAVHGIGHSMGGMLLYATAARARSEIRSVVSLGTPLVSGLNLGFAERRLLQLATKLAPGAPRRRVPLRRLMSAAGRFMPVTARFADGLLLNVSNTEPAVMARMAREAIHDVPIKLLVEILNQALGGDGIHGQAAGPYEWERHLGKIQIPMFVVSGSEDRVAPPSSVLAAFDRLTSPDIAYREMGTQSGDRNDYGHVDLLVGKDAPDEIYPTLLDFIEEAD